jgi:hypothetical protein
MAPVHLTDEQIEAIAEKAACKAVEKITGAAYQAVGKTVVQKFFVIVGVIVVTVLITLRLTNKI